ncbi:MAG: translation initiation factor IF-2 [Actinomycetota bacterium]|nr:translation initiation factor IF-2 [Actinomycetota bacterium]
MIRMRVYELAKKLGIPNAELIRKLKGLGVEVKNHFASVSPDIAEKLDGAQSAALSPREGTKQKSTVVNDKSTIVKKKSTIVKKKVTEKEAHTVAQPQLVKENKKGTAPAKSEAKSQAMLEAKAQAKPATKTQARPEAKKDRGAKPSKAAPVLEEEKPRTEEKPRILEIPQAATVKEIAVIMGKEPNELIKMLLKLGELVTINQSLSQDVIEILADEMGYQVKIINPEEIVEEEENEEEENLLPRPPVITVMGHVDHGKTSLLDSIRKTDVMSGEAGGITQHIGAYQVVLDGRKITFIDTPGHEAFTAMRARGAKVTDIAVLVVAADDGVMPQTVEAINHAKAANVPIIVAVNKIDKPEADPMRVRQELTNYGLVPEEWGGDTIFVDISAKKKINIEELLEMILLVAEVLELKANPNTAGRGICIETKLDRGRGPVATVLVNKGTMRVGDAVVAGTAYGKIRAMNDDKGHSVRTATPAQPVEIIGLSSLPQPGEEIKVVEDEKVARRIAEERSLKRRLIEQEQRRRVTLEDLFDRIQEGEVKELKLVIKADTQGSVEALKEALYKLSTDEVKLQVIHTGVGGISETDIMLAAASNAIVVGFNVRPDVNAVAMAAKESVDIRTYTVIYKAVEDISSALSGLLSPAIEEVDSGRCEVRATFRVPKVGVIAGCYVLNGEVDRNDRARLVRDGQIVYDGAIISLKRFKDDVKSVREGYECGIGLENFQDIKEGDIIETYRLVERERQLGE